MTCRTCDCADKAADTDEWVTFAKRPEILPLSAPAAPTPLAPLAGATVDEGKPVTFSWQHQRSEQEARARRAEAEVTRLTAERDALAAQVAEGVHVADVWASDLATDAMVHVMDGVVLEAINEQLKRLLELRAALADSEADTSDTQSTDPGCGCSTNPARARYADGDPAGCYCTCSDDAREGCEHEPDEPQPTDLEVK